MDVETWATRTFRSYLGVVYATLRLTAKPSIVTMEAGPLRLAMADGHFHILCRMHLEREYTDDDIRQRYKAFIEGELDTKDRELTDVQVERFRKRWEDLSEFMKDLNFLTDKEKKPKVIQSLVGVYSLKNLSEAIQ